MIEMYAQRCQESDAVVLATFGAANTFSYYHPEPVAHEIVVHDPETDPAAWIGSPRVWVFARDGIDVAPLFKRIESLYRPQEMFHTYGLSLSLYVPKLER